MAQGEVSELAVRDTGGVRIATLRNICVTQYRAELRAEDIVAVTEVSLALARRFRSGIVAFSVAGGGIALPNEEVRATAAREMARVKSVNRCAATVIEGTGFWASAARSVVTAINFVGRPGFPTRVFGDVRVAAEWVQPYSEPADGAVDAILAALATLSTMNTTGADPSRPSR